MTQLELRPNLPVEILNSWSLGCRPVNCLFPFDRRLLNSFTASLLDETYQTSPNGHCPLRDLKLSVLPLVSSQTRIDLFEELPQLPAKLADKRGYWLSAEEEELMVNLIDDWYKWYQLQEYDPYFDEEEVDQNNIIGELGGSENNMKTSSNQDRIVDKIAIEKQRPQAKKLEAEADEWTTVSNKKKGRRK